MADAITKNVGKVWWTAANRPWELHCEPFKLAPHMYYIGNTWVGCFLIDTGDGLLLIDTAIFECTYDVLQNIYTLGYNPKDIKNILLTHCHVDHIGCVPQFKSISGANVWISKEDMEFAKSNPTPDPFDIEICGVHYDKRTKALEAIVAQRNRIKDNALLEIGTYRGFKLYLYQEGVGTLTNLCMTVKHQLGYRVKIEPDNGAGNLVRLDNVISFKIIEKYNLKYIDVPFFSTKDSKHRDSAIGIYVNYLKVNNLIVVPVFGREEDKEAVDIIQKAFPDKVIETINYNEVAIEGGLLNCTTWVVR